MVPLRTLHILGLVALMVGVATTIISRRVPPRRWLCALLLLIAPLTWVLAYAGASASPPLLPMFLAFMILAPIAIVFSCRACFVVPHRNLTSIALLLGSTLVAMCLLFALVGMLAPLFAS
jgi:hypothetical protein